MMMSKKAAWILGALIVSLGLTDIALGQSRCPTAEVTVDCEALADCLDCPDPCPGTAVLKPEIVPIGGVVCAEVPLGSNRYECRPPEPECPDCPKEVRVIPTVLPVVQEYARWRASIGYGSDWAVGVGYDPSWTDSWPIYAPQTFSAVAIRVEDPTCSVLERPYSYKHSCRAEGDGVAWSFLADWWF